MKYILHQSSCEESAVDTAWHFSSSYNYKKFIGKKENYVSFNFLLITELLCTVYNTKLFPALVTFLLVINRPCNMRSAGRQMIHFGWFEVILVFLWSINQEFLLSLLSSLLSFPWFRLSQANLNWLHGCWLLIINCPFKYHFSQLRQNTHLSIKSITYKWIKWFYTGWQVNNWFWWLLDKEK